MNYGTASSEVPNGEEGKKQETQEEAIEVSASRSKAERGREEHISGPIMEYDLGLCRWSRWLLSSRLRCRPDGRRLAGGMLRVQQLVLKFRGQLQIRVKRVLGAGVHAISTLLIHRR